MTSSYWNPSACVEPFASNPCTAPCQLSELLTTICRRRETGLSRKREQELQRKAEEFHRDSWRLKRDLDDALTDEVRGEIKELISHFEANRHNYRQSFLLWIDLIEELSLETELELGDGTGPLKLRRVKAAMFHLIFKFAEPVSFPGVPSYVQPLALNLGVRWTVELIVSLVNTPEPHLNLWRNTVVKNKKPAASMPLKLQARAWSKVAHRKDTFLEWVVELLVGWSLRPPRLGKKLKIRVEAITDRWDEAAGRPPIKEMADAIFYTLRWMGTHGKEMRAAVDAISIAVHWTSELADMTMDERIELIKDALILYMEDLGLHGPLFEVLVSVVLDLTVESVIYLFQKRQVVPV